VENTWFQVFVYCCRSAGDDRQKQAGIDRITTQQQKQLHRYFWEIPGQKHSAIKQGYDSTAMLDQVATTGTVSTMQGNVLQQVVAVTDLLMYCTPHIPWRLVGMMCQALHVSMCPTIPAHLLNVHCATHEVMCRAQYAMQKAKLARGDTSRRLQLGDLMLESLTARPDGNTQICFLSRRSKTNQVLI
jgi:hypothetical protein